MKNLLKKELYFSALPLTYFFILFACMTMIPGYPILVGTFFVCMGIFQTFQSAREQNDMLYTVLMPVRKKDAVTARYLFVILIQTIFFLICVLLTIIRMHFLAQAAAYRANAMMNANPAYLGYVLMIFKWFLEKCIYNWKAIFEILNCSISDHWVNGDTSSYSSTYVSEFCETGNVYSDDDFMWSSIMLWSG